MLNWTLFYGCVNNLDVKYESDLAMNTTWAVVKTRPKNIVIYSQSLITSIWNQHNDQLPVGLLAQLVEHCTGIAKVMGSNSVQAWIFFQALFSQLLK